MNNIKNVKINKRYSKNKFMLQAKSQNCIFLKSLSKLFCTLLFIISVSTFLNPLLGQDRDTCDTEKEVVKKINLAKLAEAKAKKAADDFNKLPKLGPKPTGNSNKDETAAKTAADEAQVKWDNARLALAEEKKKLKAGTDAISLAQDIARKKTEKTGKEEDYKKRDWKTYENNAGKIGELEKKLTDNMVEFKRTTANEIMNSTKYKTFDPTNKAAIEACNQRKKVAINADRNYESECKSEIAESLLKNIHFTNANIEKLRNDLQSAVTATNASSTVSTDSKTNAWNEIEEKGPELISEIEAVQTSLKVNYEELVKLEGSMRQIQDDIKALETEIEAFEKQLKPLTDAEKNVTDTKKVYDDAKKKLNTAENSTQAENNWEAENKKRKDAEKEMNDAAAEKTKADTEKGNAENADAVFKAPATPVLNTAQTAAQLATANARMATLNRPLLREATSEVVENNAKAAENKIKFEQALAKPNITEAQKTEIKRRWGVYFRPIVRPLYIRKRNEAEADRLRGIRDDATLQSFKCVKEIHEFIIQLNQEIIRVLALKASLASDSDFGIPDDETILIPDEFIPHLDEGEGTDTPTDEVPDDLVKSTSEVKVFNVRPGAWLSTGIQLKKGQQYSITAKGTVTRQGDRTWGPDGYYLVGYMAHSLKALIGDKLVEIGSSHSGTAPVDGELKLGITWTYEGINPADSKHKGSFVATVTIDGK